MMKNIAYLSILASLIGARFISINLGFFQLSLFRILIIFLAILLILQMLKYNGSIRWKSNQDNNYSIWFFVFWFIYAFISLAWVKDYGAWVRAEYFIGLGLLSIIVFSRIFKNVNDILIAFRIIAIMSIFHNIVGWYEIITGNYKFLSSEDRALAYLGNNFPVSMFGNTNGFATFMLFSVFISYICIANSRKIISKLIYIMLIISSVYLLIMTSSRASILGLILGVIFFVLLSFRNRRGRQAIVLMLGGIFGLILFFPELINNIFFEVNQNLQFNFSSDVNSEAIRTNLIKNGFEFLLETIGFGTGAGNIEFWMANYSTYNTGGILNIHNWWMEILTGYGVITFLLYITFYFKLFRSFYFAFRNSKDEEIMTISLGIMSCMVGYVVGAISSSSNISSEWLWVFWSITIAFQGISSKLCNKNNYRTEK